MRHRMGRAFLLVLAVTLLSGLEWRKPAVAQPREPADAVTAAVASLEARGYVARFTWVAGAVNRGEMRYRSPLAYGLRVEDETGVALEYLFLDPVLYDRRRTSGDADWSGWRRRDWHPDLPIPGLTPYHPRLPLELLRAVRDLRAAEDGAPVVLEGRVSYAEAIAASYEEHLSGPARAGAGSAPLPLTIRLDGAGEVSQLVLRLIPPPSDPTPPSVLTYDFLPDEPPTLQEPSEAEEAEPWPFLRPGPARPSEALPLTLSGRGAAIESPPFRSPTGAFTAHVEPSPGEMQYRLWRIKRGRQLLAGFGASIGGARFTSPLGVLPPGEYVLELILPEAVDWTVTITEVAEAGDSPLP